MKSYKIKTSAHLSIIPIVQSHWEKNELHGKKTLLSAKLLDQFCTRQINMEHQDLLKGNYFCKHSFIGLNCEFQLAFLHGKLRLSS